MMGWGSMFDDLKPKIGCSSSIIKRWTCSSLFNVQKMMFKSIHCLIEWFCTHKYRKHLFEWHINYRHCKVQKYSYKVTECLWEGKTSTTSIHCCPFYVWATTTVIFKMRLRAFYCYVLRFLVFFPVAHFSFVSMFPKCFLKRNKSFETEKCTKPSINYNFMLKYYTTQNCFRESAPLCSCVLKRRHAQ